MGEKHIKVRLADVNGKNGESAWALAESIEDAELLRDDDSVGAKRRVVLDNDLADYPFKAGDKVVVVTAGRELPIVLGLSTDPD